MYIKPKEILSEEEYEENICEWGKEIAESGFAIFDCNGSGLLEINRIDDIYWNTNVTDEDCAREAERTGFCKIIPVDELPKNFEYRYFGWIDTLENRKAIQDYCSV